MRALLGLDASAIVRIEEKAGGGRLRISRNAEGTDLVELDPHGARHNAAINFAHNHPGGVAFVVSEDGPVKCTLRVGDEVVVWPMRIAET